MRCCTARSTWCWSARASAPLLDSAASTASCSAVMRSGRLGWIQLGFEARDLIAQQQPALLQPAHAEFIVGAGSGRLIDQAVEVGVFDPQLDQAARQRVQIDIHGLATLSRF